MSLIILEGPDGSGKTTLVGKLPPAWNATVRHHGAMLGEERIARRYLDSLRWVGTPYQTTVFDRSWLAEPIYGKAMRGGADRIAPWERRMLDNRALAAGAVLVVCLPAFETCRRVWESRLEREYLQREAQLRETWHLYAEGARAWASCYPTILYDWERDGDSVLELLGGVVP